MEPTPTDFKNMNNCSKSCVAEIKLSTKDTQTFVPMLWISNYYDCLMYTCDIDSVYDSVAGHY